MTIAVAIFLSVTSEILPTGLLREMGTSLGVDNSRVGLLATVFALTILATGTPLTIAAARVPRRPLLIAALIVVSAGNIGLALAPTYSVSVVTRIIGGIGHGVFFAVAAAYASQLVPPDRVARAVTVVIGGGSLAFVLGVPLGTTFGQLVGWRATYIGLGALVAICAAVLPLTLPSLPASAREPRKRGAVDETLRPILAICVITALVAVGHYSLYVFITPYLIDIVAIPDSSLSLALFAFGLAGAVGLLLAGTVLADRPRGGLILSVAGIVVTVAAIGASRGSAPVAITAFLVWGVAFGLLSPFLQTLVLQTASPRLRDTANSLYTGAFSAGIALGGIAGAGLYESAGLTVLPWACVILTGAGLIVLLAVTAAQRRRA